MQTIITETDLRSAIVELEARQAEEGKLLKTQALVAYESIKPINMIKSMLMETAESKDLQHNFLNSTIGLTAGYLSKFLFQGVSGGPLKKVIGTAILFGIKRLVAQNPETVKSIGKGVFKFIRTFRHNDDKASDYKETT
jgi:hypothetical protein